MSVARALSFLHGRNVPIIHRDLKPLNLLLNSHLDVKVADLGISRGAADEEYEGFKMTGGIGTLRYMAPEVVCHQSYNEKVDIYAFALILYFMSSGREPFHELGSDPERVLQQFKDGYQPRPPTSHCHKGLRAVTC